MAPASAVRRRPRLRMPRLDGARLKPARHALVVAATIFATFVGAYVALNTYTQTQQLSVGQVQISVDPGHKGSLDLYVPLVDWGVRFEDTVKLPARLHVDLRTVDRRTVTNIAQGGSLDLQDVRQDAREAVKNYLIRLILVVMLSALVLGGLTAAALRNWSKPRLRYTFAAALGTTLLIGVALVIGLPPRGSIAHPQYYAFGPDIPRALDAIEAAQNSTRALDEELDAQLVGLARLVTDPAALTPLADRPSITIASDLHNNFLAEPVLERATGKSPLFFAGDLTDRGSPLEAQVVSRITNLGDPFVFVSGNHDSDSLQIDLARRGATVLTERGQLEKDGSFGDVIVGWSVSGVRSDGAVTSRARPTSCASSSSSSWFVDCWTVSTACSARGMSGPNA